MRQTRRAGLLNVKNRTFKYEGESNDHMLHYEQVFGNVFERRESKCCAVLMKHRCKVKGKQVIIHNIIIIVIIDQKLKTKNTSDVSRQLFCCQCKDRFLRQTECIDDQDEFQSVKDTDNEFTECQTPRKKLQSIGISHVSLHAL